MNIPTHLQDQIDAATAEAHRGFLLTATAMALTGHLHTGPDRIPSDRVKELVLQCKPCEHVVTTPQPMYVILALREVCCAACLTPALNRMQAHPDQNCDVCRQFVPSNLFSEFTINCGPLLVFGCRGPCCEYL